MVCNIDIDDWYHRYVDDVHNYLVYFTGQYDVEDLVQETFIKAIKGSRDFKGTAQPKTWLLAIAQNVAIDHIRARRRTKWVSVSLLQNVPTEQSQPEQTIEEREIHQIFLAEMRKLKPSYRNVILHRVVIGLSITETAETLGWSESKVKATLHRALKTLRKSLGDIGEGGLNYDCI